MIKLKSFFLVIIFFFFGVFSNLEAQEKNKKKVYSSTSFEIIFSFSDISSANNGYSNVMRFAPVFNFQWLINYDLTNNIGLFSGLDIRNLGYIEQNKSLEPEIKTKHRVYTFGLPVGFKLGNIGKGNFLYFGYEIEWAWNYKEKRFENGIKVGKIVDWNSSRINEWQSSVLAGINLKCGVNVKFKYYFQNLMDGDYMKYDSDGQETYPYADQNSQVFYVSLNFFMFQPLYKYKTYIDGYETERAQRTRLERNSVF